MRTLDVALLRPVGAEAGQSRGETSTVRVPGEGTDEALEGCLEVEAERPDLHHDVRGRRRGVEDFRVDVDPAPCFPD